MLMNKNLRSLFVIVLLLCRFSSYATHIVGVDLFYTYVAGNTYQVTLVAYGDCAGAAFSSLHTSTPQICVYDGNTSVGNLTLTLQPPTLGVEITPVCPADALLTQCTNITYAIPGIKKFVYTGTYTLPYTSAVWRFLFTGNMGGGSSAGRGSGITNIVGPGSTLIQLVDTLNNITFHNTNPALTVLPTPFFCLNSSDNYNPGASDPDGDNLTFALVSAYNGTAVCTSLGGVVTYVPPYTPTAPLATSSFSFDPLTGQITFVPNLLQRSLVVYNIEERRSGIMVGTCQREMTFLVLTCTDVAPTGSYKTATAGTILDSTDFSICSNVGPFSISMVPTEVDTFNNITVTATGLPTGVTFTTVNNSTPHPVCTITGTTVGMPPGTYIYYVTFKDNACPLSGVRTEAFTITVLASPVVITGPPMTICPGNTATLSASGTPTYLWSPGTGLSCTTCASPVAGPPATILYTVTGTAANGCTATDTQRVTVLAAPTLIVGTTASICIGATAPLSISGAASYLWSPSATLSCSTCTNPIATPTVSTTYSVTGTGADGCTSTTTVKITVNPLPTITVLPASMCAGSTATLFPSGGVSYTWGPATSLSCTACTNPVTSVTVTTTYTVTGTDINGCKDTASVTVHVGVKPAPPAVISPVLYCQNVTSSALTGTGLSLLWYTTATGGVGSPTAPVPSTAIVGSTTWYVSQTVSGCESDRAPITVTIMPLPVITVSPATATLCSGQNTPLTASGGVSYTWGPATGLSSTTGASVIASPAATTTYTITGTGADGCTSTATASITINPLPIITVLPAGMCAGSTATLFPSGGISYTWSPATGLSCTACTNPVTSVTVTTTYTVTGTDINGCKDTASVTVHVGTKPAPPVVITPVLYCQNATSSALTATGLSLLWYTTSTGGVGSPTAPVPPTAIVGSTTWYVSQTVSGCESDRAPIMVTILPLPVIAVSPATPAICIGQDTTLTASGGASYTWGPATGLSSTTGTSVIASPAATTTYTVTGTGVNGCTNTATISVTVHPLPLVITGPTSATICAGSVVALSVAGALTYIWSPASSLSSSTAPIVSATPAITTVYTVTGTDVFGCKDTATAIVIVNPIPPPPAVVSPVIYCQNATAIALIATGTNLLWYTTLTGGIGTITAPVPLTTVPGSTTWYVSQTIHGCESLRDSITVIVKPLPTVTISPTTTAMCIGQDTTLTASGALTYSWLPFTGLSITTGPVVVASPLTTITYTITGTDVNGCVNTASQTVTVHPLPVITIPPTSVCLGSGATITASGASSYVWAPSLSLSGSGASVVVTPIGTTTYNVTGTDIYGCIGTASVTVPVFPIPPAPPVVSPVTYCNNAPAVALIATGTNLLWYTTVAGGTGSATDPIPSTATTGNMWWFVSQTVNGCESPRDTIDVIIDPNAQTNFTYTIRLGCIEDTVQFTNTSANAKWIRWNFGDGAKTDTAADPVHYYTPVTKATGFTVTLLGAIPVCYEDSTVQNVELTPAAPPVLINVTPDQTLPYGDSITLNAEGADTFLWVPDPTLSNIHIHNPEATPTQDTTYIVYGTDLNGCQDSALVHIKLTYVDDPIIPSAFTPNGDGDNDLLHILNLKYNKLLYFRIYNRWGQMIFQTSDPRQGWDGKFNGVPQELDVYQYLFYTTHPDGSHERMYKGNVTLIR
jgi:gliding motility-associated-like protein